MAGILGSDGSSSSARSRLGRVLSAALGDTEMQVLVEEALGVTKNERYAVRCKACGETRHYEIDVADASKRVDNLVKLFGEGYGKPQETRQVNVSGTVGLKAVSDMSLSEIEAELAEFGENPGPLELPPAA